MLHRAKIQEQVTALARKINAPSTVLPTFDHARDDGTPYVEIDQAGYHWVIKERGQEQQRAVRPMIPMNYSTGSLAM